ncbi:MAG TPA: hypothetical protein VN841_13480 [Bryobacteraceae bacterium]|nr:hypothetical protein [Bryobacteraceae bacterium]
MGRWCETFFAICAAVLSTRCGGTGQPAPDPLGYRQLTHDGGETNSPSLSRDGKFVVYASDRASTGNLDIWMQAVDNEASAVRLTDDPARDYDPVFSADGRTIYFSSLREPQGIYRVPASGGAAELVVNGAVSPEMSPDGRTLLFSDRSGRLALLKLADISTGPNPKATRPLLDGFSNSYAPKWSPDGQEILFTGRATQDDELEWWVTRMAGGPPVNTGLLAALRQHGFSEAYAQAWLPGDMLVFEGKRGDRITLYRFQLPEDRRGLATPPAPVTNDNEGDSRAVYSAGHLVFQRTKGVLNLWSLPVDVNQARATGEPYRLTSTDAQKGSASLTADGRTLLYSADQSGTFRLVLKDLTSGRETTVGPSSNSFYGVLSADGSRYLFGAGPPGAVDVSARGVRGWRSWWTQSICDRCGIPRGLSRDGKSLLVWTDAEPGNDPGNVPGNRIDLVDLSTGKSRTILESLSHHFFGPELSPSGDWISFVEKTGDHEFRTAVARVGAGPLSESDWVHVTAPSDQFQMAFWSPDENFLYLLNQHGEGNLNWLDAQRLDPSTKRPTGQPFNVYRFKEPRVPSMDPLWNHPAAVEGRIVLELVDLSTNVWIMNAPANSPSPDSQSPTRE